MRTIIISKQHLAALFLTAAWPAYAAHEYSIVVDESLSSLQVTAQFDRPVNRISARSGNAGRYLRNAHDCDTGRELRPRGRSLRLPSAGIRCLRYSVRLRDAAASTRAYISTGEASIVVSPTLWMWRPRLGGNDAIDVTFDVSGDTRVFVPWQAVDNSALQYRLEASPQSGSAIAIFGDVNQHSVQVPGATLTVVLLGDPDASRTQQWLDWVRSTAENILQVYDRFPNPQTSVVLIPVDRSPWGSDNPVPFGRVVRDGGEAIELFVNPARPIGEFYEEWTPTHEFSHLMLPYLDRKQRWISEGFAQYYQNVLMARAGHYSAELAWQKIQAGLEAGRQSAPRLSPNQATSGGERNTRMKIYWSGASLALMADVELRRRSGGRESLDLVLSRLQECCLPSSHAWSGIELFEKFDELLDEPLFVDLYRRYADTRGFPDASPLLERLGVVVDGGNVVLDNDAELARIRDAIIH